jgi:ABC-2 type transport system permease protein
MSARTYTRLEIVRMFRDTRFVVFSIAVPLALFLVVAGTNRDKHLGGISFPLYYMAGMASWGSMVAVVAAGSRIAFERSVGWTRQLRITPLRIRTYFGSKVLSSYLLAVAAMALIYTAGWALGVRLPARSWAEMASLVLIGLVPFATLGIVLGHLLGAESVGPAIGGSVAAFALFGGAWGPLATTGTLHVVLEGFPSYWLVQAARVSVNQEWWPARAWIVLSAWTLVLGAVAVRAFRTDSVKA